MNNDAKKLMKIAQERIRKLDQEIYNLKKDAALKEAELVAANKKLAAYDREKKVENILNILIDEKNYFPEAQRNEKRAYLMNPKTDLEAFMKMATDLNPREPGMFYEEGESLGGENREDQFYGTLINKIAHGLYG